MVNTLRYIKRSCCSPCFWGGLIITLGLFPFIVAHFIIGSLMIFLPVWWIAVSKRACVPKSEWYMSSCAALIFCSFFLVISEAFIYPLIVYGIGFFVASFSFKKQNFFKDKVAWQASIKENELFVVGEFASSVSLAGNDVSMSFMQGEKYAGTAVPVAKYGYNFTFYGSSTNCYSLYISTHKYKIPFVFPLNTYRLGSDDSKHLIIEHLGWSRIRVCFFDGSSLIIPLYKRKLDIRLQDGQTLQIGLYYKGILIKYARCQDEQMQVAITCLGYFLWLVVFGYQRNDA